MGVCGAIIVYFFLQAGLITGSIFPEFRDLGIEIFNWPSGAEGHREGIHNGITSSIVLPDRALALLVVWRFFRKAGPNRLGFDEKNAYGRDQKVRKNRRLRERSQGFERHEIIPALANPAEIARTLECF